MDDELTELLDELSTLKSELGRDHLNSFYSTGVIAYDGTMKFRSFDQSQNNRPAEISKLECHWLKEV